MDIKPPVDIPRYPAVGNTAAASIEFKLNQLLEAKVVTSQNSLNTLVLLVDDKTIQVEAQSSLDLPTSQSLQLQVVKVLPTPEFKILAPAMPQTTQAADPPTLKLVYPQSAPGSETSSRDSAQLIHDSLPSNATTLSSAIDFLDAEAEQRLIQQLRLILQRIQGSPTLISANTLSTQINDATMDIKLSLDAGLQQTTAKIANNPLNLKLDQLISAKVIDTQIALNTLSLNVADKTLIVQGKQLVALQTGQTLQLQVVKLQPAPEFKIVASSTLPQANLPTTPSVSTIDTPTLKLLNVLPQAATNTSANIALNQLVTGQQLQASVVKIADNKVIMQLLTPGTQPLASGTNQSPGNPAGSATANPPNLLISLDAKQLILQSNENAQQPATIKTILPQPPNSSPQQPVLDAKFANTGKAELPALPVLTTGTLIDLQVLKPGAAPIFTVSIPTRDTEQKLIELFKQLLPIQTSAAPLLNHLTQILPALQNDASIAETLKRLAQEILRSIPLNTQLTEPGQLKQSVDQSGLFLESKLAELLFGKDGISLQDDLKLKLVKFVQHLGTEIETQAKQQSLTNSAELLKETLQKTQGALAKLTMDQFNSIPKDESPKQTWMLELPFVHDHKAETVQIEIEQDKTGKADGSQKNWAVSITITPPELATIHCRISCYDGAVNTRFWSDGAATVEKITTHLDYLKQRFEQQGLTTGFMEAHQGTPAQTSSPNKPMTNLLSEKV